MSEWTPELRLGDEMLERADAAINAMYDTSGGSADTRELAEAAIRAAFDGVPLINYGIGLALQFFDLVVCVKDGVQPAAGVYRATGPDSFDALGHKLQVSWGHEPRYIKHVAVSGIAAPERGGEDG